MQVFLKNIARLGEEEGGEREGGSGRVGGWKGNLLRVGEEEGCEGGREREKEFFLFFYPVFFPYTRPSLSLLGKGGGK